MANEKKQVIKETSVTEVVETSSQEIRIEEKKPVSPMVSPSGHVKPLTAGTGLGDSNSETKSSNKSSFFDMIYEKINSVLGGPKGLLLKRMSRDWQTNCLIPAT